MTKQTKGLIGVIVVLAVLVAVLIFMNLNSSKLEAIDNEEDNKKTEEFEVFTIETDDANVFSYLCTDGTEISFHKNDSGVWTYDGDDSLEIDQDKINASLSKLCSLTSSEIIDSGSYADYGLDNPTAAYTVMSGDSAIAIYVGSYNEITYQTYYMLNEDYANVYVTSERLSDMADMTVEDYLVKENSDFVMSE